MSTAQLNATRYDKAHFIAKFEAIPEHRWCTVSFHRRGACCALGHCGADYGVDSKTGFHCILHTEESSALVSLFLTQTEVVTINDGTTRTWPQETPKQRILAALRSL